MEDSSKVNDFHFIHLTKFCKGFLSERNPVRNIFKRYMCAYNRIQKKPPELDPDHKLSQSMFLDLNFIGSDPVFLSGRIQIRVFLAVGFGSG